MIKEKPVHRSMALALIAVVAAASAWSTEWSIAPSDASQGPGEADNAAFEKIDADVDLTQFLVGDEGWFWLRTVVKTDSGDEAVLIDGPGLGWTAWWNGREIADSGSGPPWWAPSSPVPFLTSLPEDSVPYNTLLIKTYARRGFASDPGSVETGTLSRMTQIRTLRSAVGLFLPAMAVLLGILLFAGRLASFASSRSPRDISLSLFGLAMALGSLEPVLAFLPSVSVLVPWTALTLVTGAVLPPAISLWRRSISNSGGKEPLVVALADLFLVILLSAWSIINSVDPRILHAYLGRWAFFEPLQWYAALALSAAAIDWIADSMSGKRGRVGALLVLLAAAAPPIAFLAVGSAVPESFGAFVGIGLPSALLACLLLGTDRLGPVGRTANGGTGRPVVELPANEMFETGDDLEELEDEVPADLEMYEDFEETEQDSESGGLTLPADAMGRAMQPDEADLLLRGVRSNLFPDSLPWDSSWDLAATRQGSRSPATGFHDVYESSGSLVGFSFMDTGSGDLDSLMYASVVRGELSRRFSPDRSLPHLARTVNRKTRELATASGKGMKGLLGVFSGNGVRILPMSVPPLLLKKAGENRIVTLNPALGRASNPPYGTKGFGDEGLKTLNISMDSGDVLLAYAASLLEIRSPSNEAWGIRRLAAALRSSDSVRAEGIVSDIVGALKDFAGEETLGTPIQMLVLKRR